MLFDLFTIYFAGATATFFILLAWNKKDNEEMIKDLQISAEQYYEQNDGAAQILGVMFGAALWFAVLPFYLVLKLIEFYEWVDNKKSSEEK
jgi:hypothetical protein